MAGKQSRRSLRQQAGEHPVLVFLAGAGPGLLAAVIPLCGGEGKLMAAYIFLALSGAGAFLPLLCAEGIDKRKWLGVGVLWVVFLGAVGYLVPIVTTASARTGVVPQASVGAPAPPRMTETMQEANMNEPTQAAKPKLAVESVKENAEGKAATPTPLRVKKITIASQEEVNPAEGDPPHATEVTLHTTVDIHPTWVVLRCDEPITGFYCYVNLGTPLVTLTSYGHIYSLDRKTIWFHFQEPTFSPKTPLVVTLKGNRKITAESVDEERPPAGLPGEGFNVGMSIRKRPASLDAEP